MTPTVIKGLVAAVAALGFVAGAAVLHRRRRTGGAIPLLLAAGCFTVVALTHVFEAFAILPAAGWGQPHSIGHYVDLIAAVTGFALVIVGALLRAAPRRGG